MAVKQLSVFVENRNGRLSEVVKVLSEGAVNLRALTIGDSEDFGIIRLIVSDIDKAKALLENDYIVKTTDVVAVKLDDTEGALYKSLEVLEDADISIKYAYAFTSHSGAYGIIRVDDVASIEKALLNKGLTLATDDDLKTMN